MDIGKKIITNQGLGAENLSLTYPSQLTPYYIDLIGGRRGLEPRTDGL